MLALGAAWLVLQTAGAPLKEDATVKGSRIFGQLIEKMASVKTLEGVQVFDGEVQPGRFVKFTSRFKIAVDPFRFQGQIESENPRFREVAVFDGLTQRTSAAGKVDSRELPFPNAWRVIPNWAANPPVQTISRFFQFQRMQEHRSNGRVVFLFEDPIEGTPCDLIQVTSATFDNEWILSTMLLWISRETGWPKAIQISSFIRGQARTGQRATISEWKVNPKWDDDPFTYKPTAADSYGTLEPVAPAPQEKKEIVGTTMPDFELMDANFKPIKLKGLIKGPTLVTLFASWCGPCIQELKDLPNSKAIKELGISVVSIGVSDSKANLKRFVDEFKDPVARMLIDPDCETRSAGVPGHFGFIAIPQSLALNLEGKIVGHWVGYESVETLDRHLREAFNSKS